MFRLPITRIMKRQTHGFPSFVQFHRRRIMLQQSCMMNSPSLRMSIWTRRHQLSSHREEGRISAIRTMISTSTMNITLMFGTLSLGTFTPKTYPDSRGFVRALHTSAELLNSGSSCTIECTAKLPTCRFDCIRFVWSGEVV